MDLREVIEKEGDRKEFEYNGFQCAILRIPYMQHLSGYVNIDQLDEIPFNPEKEIQCHWEISYNSSHPMLPDGRWIGFHCAHAGDLIPSIHFQMEGKGDFFLGEYRDMEYVELWLKVIVDQLRMIEKLYYAGALKHKEKE